MRAHLRHLAARGLSADNTIRSRQNNLRRLAISIAPVGLLEATEEDIAAWRASLTVTPDTAAGYISHIQQFYAWACKNGHIAADPAASLPMPRVSRRLPRPIAEDDLMAALDCAPVRIRSWLILAAWCGLRAKEIALLRGENVLLRATPPILLIASEATKGRRERTVPLSRYAVAELAAAHLPVRGLAFLKVTGDPLPPNMVSKLCNQHLHDCGIPATLHQLRHRFGTQTYAAGHDLRVVQELLGHASPMTTAGYAAWDRAEAAAAVEAIPSPYSNPAA